MSGCWAGWYSLKHLAGHPLCAEQHPRSPGGWKKKPHPGPGFSLLFHSQITASQCSDLLSGKTPSGKASVYLGLSFRVHVCTWIEERAQVSGLFPPSGAWAGRTQLTPAQLLVSIGPSTGCLWKATVFATCFSNDEGTWVGECRVAQGNRGCASKCWFRLPGWWAGRCDWQGPTRAGK